MTWSPATAARGDTAAGLGSPAASPKLPLPLSEPRSSHRWRRAPGSCGTGWSSASSHPFQQLPAQPEQTPQVPQTNAAGAPSSDSSGGGVLHGGPTAARTCLTARRRESVPNQLFPASVVGFHPLKDTCVLAQGPLGWCTDGSPPEVLVLLLGEGCSLPQRVIPS